MAKLTWSSYDLPADVFDANEIRPKRKTKAKPASNGDIAPKKRSFSSTQMDVCEAGDLANVTYRPCTNHIVGR